MWVPAMFFTLLLGGVGVIVLHYLGALPGGTQAYQLWIGLGLITVSFAVATQWH